MTAVVVEGNPKARLWIFDFDNTLAALEQQVDWVASRVQLESFLRSEGVDERLFIEFPSRNLPLYNALLTRREGASHDTLMRQASAIIEAYELRGVDNAAPLPGAVELLVSLDAHDRLLAIATSNSSRTVARWLDRQGLSIKIGAIVGRDSLLPLKPAPEMVKRALSLIDCPAAEAVMVGDSEADLQAALQANIGFFGVALRLEARKRLAALGANKVFPSPGDLAIYLGASGHSRDSGDER
jgi:HAD superfamily hydrolase (TIGR01549 family)